MTNLKEGNEDGRWMEVTEDKHCELQEGDLYIGVIEPSCSITREFFGGKKLPWPNFMYYSCYCLKALTEITNIRDMINQDSLLILQHLKYEIGFPVT